MRLVVGGFAIGALVLAACPPRQLDGPGSPQPYASQHVNPEACGALDTSTAGRKLHGFLQASAELEKASVELEATVLDTCKRMAVELGTSPDGTTKEVCERVKRELDANLSVSVKTEKRLVTRTTPPVCHTDVNLTAGFVAQCEAKADASADVRCHGTCGGTCAGPCDGTCSSGDNATCRGSCAGECKGTCSGGCDGYVSVDASAECQASAEVRASVATTCTEPKVEVVREDVTVIDATKFDHAVAAIQLGLPKLMVVGRRVELAGKALAHWADTGAQLAQSTTDLLGELGTQAVCVGGQLAAAYSASTEVRARFEVSIEASASVSASAGAN